ncbi:MAG: hypothetical protein JNL75_05460 [Chitinophagales bacterium]|nr:hypothetical protein [Chitinophagales bacterium]
MNIEFKVNALNFDRLIEENFSLHYDFLLGDIQIRHGLEILNINFNIPLLDFANGISIIMNELNSRKEARYEFDFTEGEGLLIFTKNGNDLSIFLDYDESFLNVNFIIFLYAVYDFNKKLIDFIEKNVEVNRFRELGDLLDNLIIGDKL